MNYIYVKSEAPLNWYHCFNDLILEGTEKEMQELTSILKLFVGGFPLLIYQVAESPTKIKLSSRLDKPLLELIEVLCKWRNISLEVK